MTVSHLIGSRVETRRLSSAMGQLDSTCTGSPTEVGSLARQAVDGRHDVLGVAERTLHVAVQVDFESKGLKPGSHFRFKCWVTKPGVLSSAMGQLDSTCTQPHLDVALERLLLHRRHEQARGVAVQVDPFEKSKI